MRVAHVDKGGRATALTFTGSRGTTSVKASQFRTYGHSFLRSTGIQPSRGKDISPAWSRVLFWRSMYVVGARRLHPILLKAKTKNRMKIWKLTGRYLTKNSHPHLFPMLGKASDCQKRLHWVYIPMRHVFLHTRNLFSHLRSGSFFFLTFVVIPTQIGRASCRERV